MRFTTQGAFPWSLNSQALATTFSWGVEGPGNWNSWSNWKPRGGPPNGNHDAIFGDKIMADSTVFSDTAVTARRIDFDNQNRYVIAGAGSVNLAAGSNPKAAINVLQGTHEFQLRVNLLSETDVTVASNLTLEFNNRLNLSGNTLNKLGDGAMAVNNILNTDGGTMNVQAGIVSGSGGIGGDLNN